MHLKVFMGQLFIYKERNVLLSFAVAPLQSLSIPCLELMAAVLEKQLALSIAEILNIDREFITFWTDTTSVLLHVGNRIQSTI